MRIIRNILITLAVLVIVLPLTVTAILSSDWFRPKLTGICNSFVENGEITMDSLSVSLLEEIPLLSIKLYNGTVHSHAYAEVDPENEKYLPQIPEQAHTPVTFKQFVVSLDIPSLIFGKINIRRIRLSEPDIYGYISPWGKANWDIFGESTEEEDETEEETSSTLKLGVQRVSLSKAYVTLFDDQNKNMYKVHIERFLTSGNISLDPEELHIRRVHLRESDLSVNMKKGGNWAKFSIDSLIIRGNKAEELYTIALASKTNLSMGGKAYTRGFPLNIDGAIGMDIANPTNFDIDNTTLTIAGSPITFDGKVGFIGESIFTNLTCDIPDFHVGKAISYLDTAAFPQFKGMSTDLRIALDLKAQGRYEGEKGLLPAINADIRIPDGTFKYPGIDVEVNRLGFDATLNYDPYIVDSTSVEIRSIGLDATGITLNGNGSGTNLLSDPYFNLTFNGAADLTTLSSIFLKDAGITALGDMEIDLKGRFKSSDLSLEKIGNTKLFGRFKTGNLLVNIPEDTIYTNLKGVTLRFGSLENKRDTSLAVGEKTLQVSFSADSANVQYKDIALVDLSKARASVKSAADGLSGDTTHVHPLKGSISAKRLRLAMADSLRVRGSDLSIRASMLPSKVDSMAPQLALNTSAKRLAYRDAENLFSVTNAEIGFDGTLRSVNRKKRMNDTLAIARMERRLDSLQLIYPQIARDSLMRHSMRMRSTMNTDALGKEGNIDMSVDESVKGILDKWDANCTIKADGGRIITPYMPLRNRLGKVDITLNTNELRFKNTEVRLGRTDLNLTGRVWGIRRALTRDGKLRADLMIASDTLDVNQLMSGLNGASAYMNASSNIKDSLSKMESEEEMAEYVSSNMDSTVVSSPLLLIPGNIDMKLGLFVGYGEFANIGLNGISGNLYAKDRVLQIDNFKAITEAGNLALTALYSTKSKEDLSTGFDLELRNVQVEKLIDVVPSVDSLVPMLRSFEGILDCEVAATAKLDTNMNILLPTLNGVARIQGDDLVLLDGETFAKIAKLLRFKDRENNKIDQIAIEMLVKDNKVEMFPFVLQMDRVMAAASGVHNLDMSFKYHVSVIKSPLPMRLGLNVSGTFDDMKFRLGKPLYKSAEVPSFTKVIDESRINLKKSLTEIFNKGRYDISRIEVFRRNEEIDKALKVEDIEELDEKDKKALEMEGITLPAPEAL